MSAPLRAARQGGSPLTLALLGVAVVAFGLVGGLPDLLGPAVGVVGVVLSSVWRRSWPQTGATFGALPALVALAVLAVGSPAVPAAELFGGLATLALLLWMADDPARPAGGGRRSVLALGACAAGVGIAWSLVLVLPRPTREVGVAGGLLALGLLFFAWMLERETSARSPSGASA